MLTKLKQLVGVFYLFIGISYAQPNIHKAHLLLENGKIEEARKLYLVQTDHNIARERLGDIASFQKKWDQAIEYYRELVLEEPDNAMYNFKLGGALGMKAYYGPKLQAALLVSDIKKYLKKAAELDSNHLETRRALVEFYMQIPGILGGSEVIAESYAAELAHLNELDALLAEAFIFKYKGYKELARHKYSQAIILANKKPALLVRNYLKYELGEAAAIFGVEMEAGKRLLNQYIKDYGFRDLKSPAWAYLRLAQIAREQNDRKAALELIDRSLAIDSGFDKALEEKNKIQSF